MLAFQVHYDKIYAYYYKTIALSMEKLTLTQPDDWHLHVRNGAILNTVIGHTAGQFARAIIMPNLKSPVSTVSQALDYRQEILSALPKAAGFEPLMTLYLTTGLTEQEIKLAAQSQYVHAVKLYPAGATTNSEAGVPDFRKIYPQLAAMEKYAVPLLVHGEVTDPDCDIFDRERVFVDEVLSHLVHDFPELKIVMEHVTTKEAIDFVKSQDSNLAATITPQHLLYNRNNLFAGGIRPHNYCLPVLKREEHRQALLSAATSGNPKFFLGTDSAPHLKSAKESACGCAGCFNAFAALPLYAEAFEQVGALDKLEAFASFFGADFYQLPRNTAKVTLEKFSWQVPDSFGDEETTIIPFKAGETLTWKISS